MPAKRTNVSLFLPAAAPQLLLTLGVCPPPAPMVQPPLVFLLPHPHLLQEWKMAGNVYLSLPIEEITCKETKRGRQVLTQSSLQPSITSWFRPRRQGPYSTSEQLHFLSGQRQRPRCRRWRTAGYRRRGTGGNSASERETNEEVFFL